MRPRQSDGRGWRGKSESANTEVLKAHAAAKIAEIDARINDLQVMRAGLITAMMGAGCDDLIACARTDSCPLPFTGLARA